MNMGTVESMNMCNTFNKTFVSQMSSGGMVRKVNTTLTIREDIKEAARRFELNLSELFEQAVIQRVQQLLLVEYGLQLRDVMDSPGFEPGASALRRRRSSAELRALVKLAQQFK